MIDRRMFLAGGAALLAGCGKTAKTTRLALNWKPDPQFGGFYAAPYQQRGLDIEILPGGAGTPTVQMIGAGSAEFGVISADELVVARAGGNDVVALFATFQNCPQGIMVHASRHLSSIGDVFKEGTVALQKGLPYAQILEKKYGFDHVKIVPSPGGDISAFLHDEKFAQQCFVMSEPLGAKRNGVAVTVFPVADAGYNPYTTVLATSGDFLKREPSKVRDVVAAVREGWRIYLDSPMATNERMRDLNPTLDNQTIAEVAEAQKPYIETEETKKNGLGFMSAARWETLATQLKELGDISQPVMAEQCFKLV